MLATCLWLPVLAFHLPVTPSCVAVPGHRLAARMCSAEEEAKRAWFAKQQATGPGAHRTTADELAEQQRQREEARKRMKAAMGESGALQRGEGEAFGFGGSDDEWYGVGTRPHELDPRFAGEVDLLTGKPLSRDTEQRRGEGFGGRTSGWGRKAEVVSSSGPAMEGTLRAPGQAKLSQPMVPVQAYLYDGLTSTGEIKRGMEGDEGAAAAEAPADMVLQQEEDLLQALRSAVGEGE